MFPQPGRPAPPPANTSLYSSYSHAYNQYAQHDQNSNLQLYAGFGPEFGHSPSAWAPPSWSTQFPSACRNYEWPLEHPPPQTGGHSPTTPTSEGGLPSPNSPQFSSTTRPDTGSQSPSPSDYSGPLPSQYKPSLSPPHYKTEPASSTSELGLPPNISVTSGAPPNLSLGSNLDDHDCPSPDPLTSSRPQPARSPFEWMKKPSYPSPTGSSDPNGRTRTKDKYRVVYSDHQRLELEKEFHYSRYITIRRKAELANGIGLSERQVKIWFQNRRAKERRSLKKQDDVHMKDKLDSSIGSLGAFSPPMMGDHPFPPSSLGMSIGHHGLPQHHFHQIPNPGFSVPPIMKFE